MNKIDKVISFLAIVMLLSLTSISVVFAYNKHGDTNDTVNHCEDHLVWEEFNPCLTPTVSPSVTPDVIETPTATPEATVTVDPTNPPAGHGDGLSDGKSDGLSSCPECTKAPVVPSGPPATGRAL